VDFGGVAFSVESVIGVNRAAVSRRPLVQGHMLTHATSFNCVHMRVTMCMSVFVRQCVGMEGVYACVCACICES